MWVDQCDIEMLAVAFVQPTVGFQGEKIPLGFSFQTQACNPQS